MCNISALTVCLSDCLCACVSFSFCNVSVSVPLILPFLFCLIVFPWFFSSLEAVLCTQNHICPYSSFFLSLSPLYTLIHIYTRSLSHTHTNACASSLRTNHFVLIPSTPTIQWSNEVYPYKVQYRVFILFSTASFFFIQVYVEDYWHSVTEKGKMAVLSVFYGFLPSSLQFLNNGPRFKSGCSMTLLPDSAPWLCSPLVHGSSLANTLMNKQEQVSAPDL